MSRWNHLLAPCITQTRCSKILLKLLKDMRAGRRTVTEERNRGALALARKICQDLSIKPEDGQDTSTESLTSLAHLFGEAEGEAEDETEDENQNKLPDSKVGSSRPNGC